MPNNRGNALITALFIMTLVAIAATAMSSRLQLDIYRTHAIIENDKVYLASQALTFWAMNKLRTAPKLIGSPGGKLFNFPRSLKKLSPEYSLKGELYDLQARFNLNNLQDNLYYATFLNLLDNALPNLEMKEREAIAAATRLWLIPFTPGRGKDELMGYYLKQKPPYYAGQQLFQNSSEFRLVRGVTTEIYQALSPLITALPETTPINLNTAPKIILMSLGTGLDEEQVQQLIDKRSKKGGLNPNTLSALLKKLNLRSDQVTLDSKYFKIIGTVSNPDYNFSNVTVLKRHKDSKGKMAVSIIEESLNSL